MPIPLILGKTNKENTEANKILQCERSMLSIEWANNVIKGKLTWSF